MLRRSAALLLAKVGKKRHTPAAKPKRPAAPLTDDLSTVAPTPGKLSAAEAAARMAAMDLGGSVPTAAFVYVALLKAPHLRKGSFEERMMELMSMWDALPSAEKEPYLKNPLLGLEPPQQGRNSTH